MQARDNGTEHRVLSLNNQFSLAGQFVWEVFSPRLVDPQVSTTFQRGWFAIRGISLARTGTAGETKGRIVPRVEETFYRDNLARTKPRYADPLGSLTQSYVRLTILSFSLSFSLAVLTRRYR